MPAPARRHAALLRGVSPVNCQMADLRAAFEAAGFAEVRTVLSSGNVLFGAPRGPESALAARVDAALRKGLGRTFFTLLRPVEELAALVAEDPWAGLEVPEGAKQVVTFLARPPASRKALPGRDGVTVHLVREREVLTSYLPSPKGPVFMSLLEGAFGTEVTTRTWDTVRKLAR